MYIYICVFRGFYIRLFVRTRKTSLRGHWSDAYKIEGSYPKMAGVIQVRSVGEIWQFTLWLFNIGMEMAYL